MPLYNIFFFHKRHNYVTLTGEQEGVYYEYFRTGLYHHPTACASPIVMELRLLISLRWRHNERDNVLNHQPHDCLLNH